jgi:hypothetical protein
MAIFEKFKKAAIVATGFVVLLDPFFVHLGTSIDSLQDSKR